MQNYHVIQMSWAAIIERIIQRLDRVFSEKLGGSQSGEWVDEGAPQMPLAVVPEPGEMPLDVSPVPEPPLETEQTFEIKQDARPLPVVESDSAPPGSSVPQLTVIPGGNAGQADLPGLKPEPRVRINRRNVRGGASVRPVVVLAAEVKGLVEALDDSRGEKGAAVPASKKRESATRNEEIRTRTAVLAREVLSHPAAVDATVRSLADQYLQYSAEVVEIKAQIDRLRQTPDGLNPEQVKSQIRSLNGKISALRNFRMTPLRKKILVQLEAIGQTEAQMGEVLSQGAEDSAQNGGLDLSAAEGSIDFVRSQGRSNTGLEDSGFIPEREFIQLFQGFDFRIIGLQPMDRAEVSLLF